MNFKKTFEMSPEMRSVLPAKYTKTSNKNFLKENIRKLRDMQHQMDVRKKTNEQEKKKSKRIPLSSKVSIKSISERDNSTSDESLSARSGGGNTARSCVPGQKYTSLVSPVSSKQFVDQGVQTNPTDEPIENEEFSLSPLRQEITNISTINGSDGILNGQEKVPNKLLKNNSINFVELNRNMEYKSKTAKQKSDPNGIPPNYQFGELPRYLKEMKKVNFSLPRKNDAFSSNDQQDVLLNDEDHPGYIILSDEDRLEHLQNLKDSYDDLILQFNQLPARSDSLKARKKRAHLEKELENIDNSIKLFSRGKLYIQL